MLFCSLKFLVFFAIVFAVYWSLPWHRARVMLLLAASFFFYASWSHWLAVLIVVSTIADYLIARGLEALAAAVWRRVLLLVSLVANLGLLVYFKYANFFLHSLEDALRAAGAEASLPVLKVILPIGISFYTFEAINYIVDVYRRQIPAEKNLFHFMLFILFFPHLIAGPIVRARDFLPQVRRRKRWSWPRLHFGAQLCLMGLFKKLAIADRMALYADPVFAAPEAFGAGALWLAALAYALQVYCDFSGYTDLALGTAHMLGYKLSPNFNLPFLAVNVADFWRRWHTSLSSWIRDYLFIPLGGSRGGTWRTARNLLVTMGLAGLWHGANWPFLVFGLLQGAMLIVHRQFRGFCEARPRLDTVLRSASGTTARIALTFACFVITLAIFRSNTVMAGFTTVGHMLGGHGGAAHPLETTGLWLTVAVVALCHALAIRARWQTLADWVPAPVRGLAYGGILTLALILAPDASKAFIYFQF